MDIDIIVKKLNQNYYKSLIKNLSQNNISYDWLCNHYSLIDNNIYKQNNITDDKKINKQIDENMYKKPWTKLNTIHKNLKMKEFVNNLNISNESDKNKLKDELLELIKNKILSKKENVKYDEENGKIISLVKLEYNNGKYSYPK
jgi:hypothetical protein